MKHYREKIYSSIILLSSVENMEHLTETFSDQHHPYIPDICHSLKRILHEKKSPTISKDDHMASKADFLVAGGPKVN